MNDWRRPPVGQPPHEAGPQDSTPPHGMVRVMGVRLPPPPRPPRGPLAPLGPPPRRTLPGMPAPPYAQPYLPVPELFDEDEITEPASPAYRERRMVADFRMLPEEAKQRAERYIQALVKSVAKKR